MLVLGSETIDLPAGLLELAIDVGFGRDRDGRATLASTSVGTTCSETHGSTVWP